MTGRSIKHFWWVWIDIEIVFVSMLFLAFAAKASPIWECKSEGRWSQSPIGDFKEIPKTDDTDTTILEFQAPNKMKVIKVKSEFGRSVYEHMDWEKVSDKYYGTAVVRHLYPLNSSPDKSYITVNNLTALNNTCLSFVLL